MFNPTNFYIFADHYAFHMKQTEVMKQHIKLIDIYHADLFSRSKAVELAGHINETAEEVVLDFQGIGFMSRSFADELYSITHSLPGVSFTYQGRIDVVETMMDKVAEGRTRERRMGISHPVMYKFDSKQELMDFLMRQ